MRSLAKQAEIKDDEPTDQRAPSAGTSGSNSAANNMHIQQQRPSNSAENRNVESAVAMDNRQKRKANSPPPEKVFFGFVYFFFGFQICYAMKAPNFTSVVMLLTILIFKKYYNNYSGFCCSS